MKDLIILAGAPGVGKTTISNLLAKELHSFVFDYGNLRQFHLDRTWSNANETEEEMSFENLKFILENYKKHGYKNIILNDLQDFRVLQIPDVFSDLDFIIFSFFVSDDAELKQRIEGPRDSGFRDVQKATEWNHSLIQRPSVKNEHKIDNTNKDPKLTIGKLIELLK